MRTVMWVGVSAALGAFAVPASARADGPFVSVATGAGMAFDSKDDCELAPCAAVQGEVGGHVTARIDAFVDGSAYAEPGDPDTLRFTTTFDLRVFASARLWFTAGAGVGTDHHRLWTYDPTTGGGMAVADPRLAPAGVLAVGWDVVRRSDHALDVQLRASSTFPDVHHTGAIWLLVGVRWF